MVTKSSSCLVCEYCGRNNFETRRALTQHHSSNKACFQLLRAKAAGVCAYQVPHDYMRCLPIIRGTGTQKHHDARRTFQMGELSASLPPSEKEVVDYRLAKRRHCDPALFNYEEDENQVDFGNDSDSNEPDSDEESAESGAIDQEICRDFREYCVKAEKYFHPLDKKQRKAVRLMFQLRQTKASLDTYDAIMEWHLKETGELRQHEKMGDTFSFLSRKRMFMFLRCRYNMKKSTTWSRKLCYQHQKLV